MDDSRASWLSPASLLASSSGVVKLGLLSKESLDSPRSPRSGWLMLSWMSCVSLASVSGSDQWLLESVTSDRPSLLSSLAFRSLGLLESRFAAVVLAAFGFPAAASSQWLTLRSEGCKGCEGCEG